MPHDPAVVARQVALLYRNIPASQFATIVNASLLAWICHDGTGAVATFWWIAAALAVAGRLLLRQAFVADSAAPQPKPATEWLRLARVGALASGLVWTIGALLFMHGADSTQQTFTALVMAGMVSGSAPTLGADLRSFRLFAWPIILTTALAALGPDKVHIAFCIMALFFLVTMTYSTNNFHRTLLESLRLEHEKDRLLATLAAAKEALERSDRAKSEFLANISHELRTPMNGIVGMSDLLGMENMSPSQQQFLALLRDSSAEMLDLINNLIELSAIEAGQLQLDPQLFSPTDMLPALVIGTEKKARAKSLGFHVELDDKLPPLLIGDVGRLRKILRHLADNAVKFSESGEVSIVIRALDESGKTVRVEFAVADTGMGIPADQLEAIFEPFTQADGSVTRRHAGAGIGLPICRKLTALMHGSLSVESTPGVGSVFRLVLPFERPEPDFGVREPCPGSSSLADRSPA